MNKIIEAVIFVAVLGSFCIGQNIPVPQNVSPPILLQQNPVPVGNKPLPPAPEATLPPSFSPPSAPGIPVIQTISAKALMENLPRALVTVQKLSTQFMPGKVWIIRAPDGQREIKGGVLYQGVVVAVLHFSPMDGSILPSGVNSHSYVGNVSIQSVKSGLSAAVSKLKILPAAEFIEPEASWSFPLVYQDFIVAHIKILYDGIHVIQNYPENQEMTFYGQ